MKTIAELKSAKLRETLEAVKAEIQRIAGDGARMIVYGSYARGEERDDSDVDLMVILPDEKYTFEIKDEIHDAVFEIGYEAEFLISIFFASESIARKFEGFKVFASVEREGVLV